MKSCLAWIALGLVLTLMVGCGGATGTLVKYHRTGGFAGFDDQLTVASSGHCVLARRGKETRFTLSGDAMDNLKKALTASGFSKLDKEYTPSQPGADLMTYEITYQGRTVKATDGAVPDALSAVINALNQIVSDHGAP